MQLRLEQLEKDWDGGAGEIALKSHPTQVVDAIEREERRYKGCQVLKEWDEALKREWGDVSWADDMWDSEEEVEEAEWTDNFRAQLREVHVETEPGPAWAPNREEPVVLSVKPRHKRMMRELAKPRDGYSGSAKTVVEVWRRQRRRGEQSEYNHLWWRMDYQQLRALEESSGLTPRRIMIAGQETSATYPNEFYPDDMPTQSHLLNDVVFQQLDAHPKRGGWSDCRGHLATASADKPLKFLEFIEDAARVLPPQCRSKLPRCMTVATPDNPIFNISKRVGGWFEV